MKQVIIMRGIPGSGKSRYVERRTRELELAGADVEVVSADFFWDQREFDKNQLIEAHAWAQRCFLSLRGRDMEEGQDAVVFVDQTSSRVAEYAVYEAMADAYGWEVAICEIKCPRAEDCLKYALRNVHFVPLSKCFAMWERWEADPRANGIWEEV